MQEIKLDVQVRGDAGTRKIKSLRREDFVPGIVYGGDKKPTAIKVDRRAFDKIMRGHKGQSLIFHLNVLEGQKKVSDYAAIVRDEQMDPVRDQLIHLDFQRISLTEELEVKVPVESKGEAAGVKQQGGSLEHILWELDIICLPTNIPEKIVVDVTNLKIGDTVHVGDLVLPNGVRTKHDKESLVFTVAAPMKEEAPAAEGEAITEPEVLKEKKKEPAAEGAAGEKAEKQEKK